MHSEDVFKKCVARNAIWYAKHANLCNDLFIVDTWLFACSLSFKDAKIFLYLEIE